MLCLIVVTLTVVVGLIIVLFGNLVCNLGSKMNFPISTDGHKALDMTTLKNKGMQITFCF
jgi:hypothetical protein